MTEPEGNHEYPRLTRTREGIVIIQTPWSEDSMMDRWYRESIELPEGARVWSGSFRIPVSLLEPQSSFNCTRCWSLGTIDDPNPPEQIGVFAQYTIPCPRCSGTGIYVSRARAGLAEP